MPQVTKILKQIQLLVSPPPLPWGSAEKAGKVTDLEDTIRLLSKPQEAKETLRLSLSPLKFLLFFSSVFQILQPHPQ